MTYLDYLANTGVVLLVLIAVVGTLGGFASTVVGFLETVSERPILDHPVRLMLIALPTALLTLPLLLWLSVGDGALGLWRS